MRVTRSVVLLGLVVLAIAVPFFLRSRVAIGQQNFPQTNRKPACTCFCGDGTFHSFNIFPKAAQLAGKCYGGPLPPDLCRNDLSNLPPGELQALCQNAKARDRQCPALKPLCKDTSSPGNGCNDPATPWFGDSPGCKDTQAPAVAISGRAVTVSICGYEIFRGMDPKPGAGGDPQLFLTAYLEVMRAHVQQQVGSKVCCDKLRDAVRTGTPCDAKLDVDCDGKPNTTDVVVKPNSSERYPDINLFSRQSAAPIDEFPAGLDPDDANFMPGSTARDSKGIGECPCKWELAKGTLACSPDGVKDHVYTATWKCPANGKEVFTTKYAKATAPCAKRTAGLDFLFYDLDGQPTPFLKYLRPELSAYACGG